MPKPAALEDRQLTAALDLLGHTGAAEVKLWYCDEEKPPLVWVCAARWAQYGGRWECAAASHPLTAGLPAMRSGHRRRDVHALQPADRV